MDPICISEETSRGDEGSSMGNGARKEAPLNMLRRVKQVTRAQSLEQDHASYQQCQRWEFSPQKKVLPVERTSLHLCPGHIICIISIPVKRKFSLPGKAFV
ncbi:Denn Domain-Containing Protein 2A [Manis pentadactyla]|nr:Denn Domain-Containing Protein 2A [Manis pentadactyla]